MTSTGSHEPPCDRRAWRTFVDGLPPLRGRTILDLGCGVGEQAAELAARGARVIGIDLNEDALKEARSRRIPGAELRVSHLLSIPDLGRLADGIWGSYVAAYFTDLPAALAAWRRHLQPGGWIALTEIDDLFGHEPLSARARVGFEAYARDALAAKRYDFHMGRKLAGFLERSGFNVSKSLVLEDREFSFVGPAVPEVIESWRRRFERMGLLPGFLGASYDEVREEFLACLSHPRHVSTAKVCCCVAAL